jgi:hypothetical protein
MKKSFCNMKKSFCNMKKSFYNMKKSFYNMKKSFCNAKELFRNMEKSDINTVIKDIQFGVFAAVTTYLASPLDTQGRTSLHKYSKR